jgi:hypothetical protein
MERQQHLFLPQNGFSIAGFLDKLGIRHIDKAGEELIYQSPSTSCSSKTQVLRVNDRLGVWYDNGSGKGGTLLDLALLHWNLTDPAETQRRLKTLMAPEIEKPKRRRIAVPFARVPTYHMSHLEPLGRNKTTADYLASLKLLETARDYIEEVHYYTVDGHGRKRYFTSAGWKNRNGVWEVENPFYKGSLGEPDICVCHGDPGEVHIFENMFDCLGYIAHCRKLQLPHGFKKIVLNKPDMASRVIPICRRSTAVKLFLRRNRRNESLSAEIRASLSHVADCSDLYAGHGNMSNMWKAVG